VRQETGGNNRTVNEDAIRQGLVTAELPKRSQVPPGYSPAHVRNTDTDARSAPHPARGTALPAGRSSAPRRAAAPHRRRRGSPMPPQSDRGWHCCPTALPRCRRLRLSTCWLSPEGCLLQRIYDVARYLSDMFAPSHAINAERIAELAACVLSLTSAFSRASRIACLLSPLTISASV